MSSMKFKSAAFVAALAATASIGYFGEVLEQKREYNGLPSMMPVSAMAIGAADGMKKSGWSNPEMEERVDALREHIPTSLRDRGFESMPMGMKLNLVNLYVSTKQEAAAGTWNEKSLEGYIETAEMGGIGFMELYMKIRSEDLEKSPLEVTEFAAFIDQHEGEMLPGGHMVGFGFVRDDEVRDYAKAALSQALSYDARVDVYMEPAYDAREATLGTDFADSVVIDRWNDLYNGPLYEISENSGMFTPVDEVMAEIRADAEARARLEAETPSL